MAKANDPTSTIVWIWLRDALSLAVERLGSVALAKKWLIEWLAAGKLPWTCREWKGLSAEELAEKRREKLAAEALVQKRREQGEMVGDAIYSLPSATYCQGDPSFWIAKRRIDWDDNAAYEPRVHGAQALGIRVSKTHLLAQLPEEPRERVETPGQAKAAEREKMGPKDWLAWARNEYRQQRNERPNAYISRLHDLMEKTGNVTVVWTFKTFRVRYYEAVKADQQTVQKAR